MKTMIAVVRIACASAFLLAPVLGVSTAGAQDSAAPGQAPAAAPAPIARPRPATPDDLELRPGTLTLVTDDATGDRFLVFTYTVANKTPRTQRFTPRFELLMGDGTLLEGGKGVDVDAGVRIRRAAAGPRALDQFQVMGDVAVGEQNAKEGVVIFPAKGDMKDMTLFVSGTSIAIDRVPDPKSGKETIVRRTWVRHYGINGAADPRRSTEAAFDSTKDEWVMR
jgi:hypothetical protein